jgi:hypothetical protein
MAGRPTRKRIDPQARLVHASVGRSLRKLMKQAGDKPRGIGIIRLANQAGIGVGSIQSVLNDPDHSPSLRVLDRLSRFFNLKGVHTLVRGMEYEDELNNWLAANRLPYTINQEDAARLQRLCWKVQSFDAIAFAMGAAKEMTRSEFDVFLARLERNAEGV